MAAHLGWSLEPCGLAAGVGARSANSSITPWPSFCFSRGTSTKCTPPATAAPTPSEIPAFAAAGNRFKASLFRSTSAKTVATLPPYRTGNATYARASGFLACRGEMKRCTLRGYYGILYGQMVCRISDLTKILTNRAQLCGWTFCCLTTAPALAIRSFFVSP